MGKITFSIFITGVMTCLLYVVIFAIMFAPAPLKPLFCLLVAIILFMYVVMMREIYKE